MPAPVFALYLTCLLFANTAETTDLKSSSSAHQENTFLQVKTGEKLTLHCSYKDDAISWLYWCKQSLGQRPRLISRYYKYGKNVTFQNELKDNPRFTLDTETGKNHLTISDLRTSDSATYYCMSLFRNQLIFEESITVIVKGSGFQIPTLVHQSASEIIQPGGCTVQTGTCDGEHSVYGFKNSGESHPGVIYTRGNSNDQCERKPNTQTHTCFYNLPMKNLSVSSAGTYYCAVASCGHILFGNGTKLDFKEKSFVLVYMLSGALMFTSFLVVFLSVSLYKMKRNDCRFTGSQATSFTSAAATTEGYQEEDSLHYAALSVNLPNRSRKQRNNAENECVYSSVKQ